MRLFPERIRRSKEKRPKKFKKIYTDTALQKRDSFGLRPRDYLYVLLSGLITFIIAYYLYHFDPTKSLLTTALVMIIVLLLLRKLLEEAKRKEIVGWLIVWKDPAGFYHVPAFHNMKLVYGRGIQMPDGSVQSIPETFYMTYYIKKETQRSFNPMLNTCMRILQELESKGEHVYWADGTNKFRNPLDAMSYLANLKESKGLTSKNIKKTTAWITGQQKAGG